jgi:hypothetical protein
MGVTGHARLHPVNNEKLDLMSAIDYLRLFGLLALMLPLYGGVRLWLLSEPPTRTEVLVVPETVTVHVPVEVEVPVERVIFVPVPASGGTTVEETAEMPMDFDEPESALAPTFGLLIVEPSPGPLPPDPRATTEEAQRMSEPPAVAGSPGAESPGTSAEPPVTSEPVASGRPPPPPIIPSSSEPLTSPPPSAAAAALDAPPSRRIIPVPPPLVTLPAVVQPPAAAPPAQSFIASAPPPVLVEPEKPKPRQANKRGAADDPAGQPDDHDQTAGLAKPPSGKDRDDDDGKPRPGPGPRPAAVPEARDDRSQAPARPRAAGAEASPGTAKPRSTGTVAPARSAGQPIASGQRPSPTAAPSSRRTQSVQRPGSPGDRRESKGQARPNRPPAGG